MRDNPAAHRWSGGRNHRPTSGVPTMRKLFMLIGIAGLAFGACEKPTTTTPPPGDTAGAADGGAAASAGDSAGAAEAGGDAGAGEAGAADAGGEGGAATEPGAPGVAWADKTFKQRQEYMGITVLPKMKSLFQGHDATAFGTFKCQTCHGNDMAAKKFKMPNDGIYPLNPADPVKGAREYDEKITKFMLEQVTPQMAEMLDETMISKDNPNGFGCMRCHPAE